MPLLRNIFALAVMILTLACPFKSMADYAPTTQPQTDAQRMAAWWDDLAKPEPHASRALLNFSTKPADTVAFFKQNLLPLVISEEDLNKLIADLSSDDDAVWKPAFEKLEYFDPRLTIDLQSLMTNVTEPVARCRLVAILCDYPPETFEGKNVSLRNSGGEKDFNFVADNSSWWAECQVSRLTMGGGDTNKKKWTRALRAIVLLEHIATPDAIDILRAMSVGHADAAPTKAAIESLKKLKAQ